MKFKKINFCRCCGSKNLKNYINFGKMYLSTAFPKTRKNNLKKIPMTLVICSKCHLAQLGENYELSKLYNNNYGYKSGINDSMKAHLKNIVKQISYYIKLKKNDLVIDIASNDGTLLKNYNSNLLRLGIDPVIKKYKDSYKNIKYLDTFFSKEIFKKNFKNKKAKVITSIAVFYDVEKPNQFVSDLAQILDNDGIWVLEQSYFPHLISNNAYDSICHEHLTYFAINQLNLILKKFNLEIFNIETNEMNGGSIRYFIKFTNNNKIQKNYKNINYHHRYELRFYKNFKKKLFKFKNDIQKNRTKLLKFIKKKIYLNKTIHVYGASTKGNVILQYCGINEKLIEYAAERNPDKFGRFTPGSNIKIISEKESRHLKPDYYLVMPWHFKKEIINREKKYSAEGGKMLFPLPNFQII